MADEEVYRYAPLADEDAANGCTDLSTDPKIALLACCIADQQRAGFGAYLDLREVPCSGCQAPGFNTGWGVFRHTCGAEVHGDGETAEPCPKLVERVEAAS